MKKRIIKMMVSICALLCIVGVSLCAYAADGASVSYTGTIPQASAGDVVNDYLDGVRAAVTFACCTSGGDNVSLWYVQYGINCGDDNWVYLTNFDANEDYYLLVSIGIHKDEGKWANDITIPSDFDIVSVDRDDRNCRYLTLKSKEPICRSV